MRGSPSCTLVMSGKIGRCSKILLAMRGLSVKKSLAPKFCASLVQIRNSSPQGEAFRCQAPTHRLFRSPWI